MVWHSPKAVSYEIDTFKRIMVWKLVAERMLSVHADKTQSAV